MRVLFVLCVFVMFVVLFGSCSQSTPGGTLAAYIMIFFFGQSFLQSAGTRKLPFFLSSLVSIGILLPSGKIHWLIGLSLGVGSLFGGYLGSQVAVKKGNQWTRGVFLAVVFLSALHMLRS